MKNKLQQILLKYKNNKYKHKCFETSIELLMTLAENNILATLVHANITMEHGIAGHAWVEYNNIVIDLTQPLEYRISEIDKFYELAKIKKIIKYSFLEVQELVIATNDKSFIWVDWLIYND